MVYLNQSSSDLPHGSLYEWIQTILKVVPSGVLTLALSIPYAKSNLALSFLLLTMTFVTYNTVCTAQYFMWYICFIPVIVSQRMLQDGWRNLSSKAVHILTLSWVGALLAWLFHAYKLEILGENSFFTLFLASIIFHVVNVAVVISVIISN